MLATVLLVQRGQKARQLCVLSQRDMLNSFSFTAGWHHPGVSWGRMGQDIVGVCCDFVMTGQ